MVNLEKGFQKFETRHKATLRPAAQKHASTAQHCEKRAMGSGPHTEAEYAERVAASRRLGLVMGLVIVAIFTIVQWVAS